MAFRGHIENGTVVLDERAPLPDGTVVEVLPLENLQDEVGEELARLAGRAAGLPPDLAERHDYYRREKQP